MIISYAKINIFLKIVARDYNGYHHLISRFVKYKKLYDTITFTTKSKPSQEFIINGNFDCTIEQNTIHKAYILLLSHTKSAKLKNFFYHHQINVDKNIPSFAGLGGGSSNCASFLIHTNDILNLSLSLDTLCLIGKSIGSDVVFFIKDFDSANVYKEGSQVERFEDEELDLEVFTPDINCSTKAVFSQYKRLDIPFFQDSKISKTLLNQNSKDILEQHNALFLNDLYKPAISIYPKLEKCKNANNFFSGSGSSFFETTRDTNPSMDEES